MIRKGAAAFGILAALAVAAHADFEPGRWRYARAIEGPKGAGLAALRLDEAVFGKAQLDLSDLRVTTEDGGSELPYFLVTHRGRAEQVSLAAREYNRVVVPGEKTVFELEVAVGPTGATYNRVEIATSSSNFRRRISVEGATERGKYGLIRDDAQVFDFTGDISARYAIVRLEEEVSFPFLRVTIHDDGLKPLEGLGASIERRREPVPTLEPHAPASVARAEDPKRRRTEIVVDLGARGIPVERVDLAVPDAAFARAVEVSGSDDATPADRFRSLATGYVFRYERGGRRWEHLRLDLPESRWRFLRLSILNGDDRPLGEAKLSLQGAMRRLVLERPAGDAPLKLRYGNPEARPPEYDLARRVDVPDAAALPALTLGLEEADSRFAAPTGPQKPWTEEHPAVLYGALGAAILVLGLLAWRALTSPPPKDA